MNRFVFMGLFMLIFLGIIFLMHFYAFSRLAHFFSISKGNWFYWIIGLLSASFLLANIFERTLDGTVGKLLYISASTWLGAVFILFWVTLIFDLASLVLKLKGQVIGIIILSVWVILMIYSLINAANLTVRETTIQLDGLKEDLKVVHISDIHLGAVNKAKFADEIAKKINSLNPDAVFLTGDLADGSGDFTDATIAPLNSIKAPIFYVTGNHENYLGLEQVFSILNKTKINVLRHDLVEFKGIQLIGFDYPMEGSGNGITGKIDKIGINKSKPSILLYHAPQELSAAKNAGIDLMLVGHVHGGQIFPFNAMVRLVFPYTKGLHNYEGMQVHVSTGAGTWGPPMRLGSNSEMVVINLVKK